MFEQESYSFEVQAEPLREGDLFYQYEIGSWTLTRRIYTILGISALLNLAFIGVLGQTNVLTTRGCDSPFVGRVCQVLDMAYVGTVLFGTEREYVDAAYDKIDLDDAEVTWIDQTGVPPLYQYPEGYFYKEPSAEQPYGMNPDGFIAPGIPSNPTEFGRSLIDTPAMAPKSNPNAVTGKIPDSPFDLSDTDTASTKKPKRPKNGKGNINANSEIPNEDQTASNSKKPEVTPTDPVNGVELNKRPVADLGNTVNDLIAKNELDLQTPFIGSAKGRLTKDGRIDPKTLKLLIESPDKDMQLVVKEGILAIDAAGYLQYLKAISGKDFDLLLQQDETNISATVQSEMESDTRARSIKSSLDLALSFAKMKKESADADQNDKDDLELLKNAKIETIGKRVVITFVVPKAIAHPMIQRKLAEQAAEMKKPSGNAITKSNVNTAAK
jgi:hypothetical protein